MSRCRWQETVGSNDRKKQKTSTNMVFDDVILLIIYSPFKQALNGGTTEIVLFIMSCMVLALCYS